MLRSLTRSFLVAPRKVLYRISCRNESSSERQEVLSQHRGATNLINEYTLRLHDPHMVNIVAEELRSDIASNRFILEANPGPGLLTRRLLDLGCNKLRLLEAAGSPFIPLLRQLQQENSDRVDLVTENLLRMASMTRSDVLLGTGRMMSVLEGIPHRSWDEEPGATAVVALPQHSERRFLFALLYAFSQRSMIFATGRVDLLVFVSSEGLHCLKRSGTRTGYASILFDLYFDTKTVSPVPPGAFKIKDTRRSKKAEHHPFALVRLTPKTDIFKRFPEPRRVEGFTFFIKQSYLRGARLKYLNTLIPNSVRDILLKTRWSETELVHLTPVTKLSSLKPEELLRIYEILSQHSLFPSCPLANALDIEMIQADRKSKH